MRDVSRRARYADHGSPFVEFDERLGQIEVDRSTAAALASQNIGQLAHRFETWDQTGIALAQAGVAFEQQVDAGIRHALDAANHTSRKFLRNQVALMIEFKQRRHHQSIHLRVERADVGRELEGQHGNGAIGKIDAGAAQTGFDVDRRARTNVVAHVGDMDVQGEIAAGQLVDPDGVVEIARCFAVDRDHFPAPKIAPAFELWRRDDERDVLGLLNSVRRKAMRQGMLADHDLDVHAEISMAAEDCHYAAYSGFVVLGKFEQLDVDDQAFHIGDVCDDDGLDAHAVNWRAARSDFPALANIDPLVNTFIPRS